MADQDPTVGMKDRGTILGEPPDSLNTFVPGKGAFTDGDEFMGNYKLTRILDGLIERDFPHLKDFNVSIVFKAKGSKKGHKVVLGQAKKPSGELRFYSGADFLIVIAADHCRLMTNWQIEALVYHELCHCGVKDVEGKDPDTKETIISQVPTTEPHDVEMFYSEVTRYGTWRNDLRAAQEAFTQLTLVPA